MPTTRPHRTITEVLLRELAGPQSYSRGVDYARAGAVTVEAARTDAISAMVLGTQLYCVALCWTGDELEGECDCPVGSEGDFCKHQVAVALVWSGRDGVVETGAPGCTSKREPRTPS